MIYFDHAATTRMSEAAIEVFTSASREFFANSESLHDAGTKSAALLEKMSGKFCGNFTCANARDYVYEWWHRK